MADDQRTQPPTARRLQRARREGDHPISAVLVSFGALTVAALAAPSALGLLIRRARSLLAQSLQSGGAATAAAHAELSGTALSAAGLSTVQLVALLLGPAAIAALVLGLWQTGAGLSLTPLAWNSKRLDPLASLERLWSRRTLVSLLRWLITGALLGTVGLHLLETAGAALAASIGSIQAAARLAAELCSELLWLTLAVLALGSVVDALVVRGDWLARLRMTRQEVLREQRENEGDAELARSRQRAHRELAQSAQLGELSRSRLLVIGRPRLATALAYDAELDRAPRILMQGSGRLAQTLEALAAAYAVPVREDPELARALAALAPDEPIPAALYASVAAAMRAARS